jgi:intein/homing endonuclease
MELSPNDPVAETLRRLSRQTTPDELKRRGVSNLRSVSLTRVSMLIEKAVNRALLARTLHNDAGEDEESAQFESVSVTARKEFMAMATSDAADEEELSGVEEHAVSALDQLKAELAGRRREVAEQERALRSVGGLAKDADEELAAKLRILFVSRGSNTHAPSALEREVIQLAVGELRRERGKSERERLRHHQDEISVLERRIGKLTGLLAETEGSLARAQKAETQVEGIASEYDGVQGLSGDDELHEKKSELMTAIFEANMQMREAAG